MTIDALAMLFPNVAVTRGIAVRVAGSWITAIGVLVLATSGRAILHS